MASENRKVSEGSVTIQDRAFFYECWSNNSDVKIKLYHKGKKGEATEFFRRHKKKLKEEMIEALINDHIIKENKIS